MWCTRTNCLNRADFTAKMAKKREGRGEGRDTKMKATNNFCIALSALKAGKKRTAKLSLKTTHLHVHGHTLPILGNDSARGDGDWLHGEGDADILAVRSGPPEKDM
eukprot:12513585-Ditylum_brightwellii.AAC.1